MGEYITEDYVEQLEDKIKQLEQEIKILKKPWLQQELTCKEAMESNKGVVCRINFGFCMHIQDQERCTGFELK